MSHDFSGKTIDLTCIVHTRDSEATLEKCLASVTWARDLVVVDMQSSDHTLDIARRYQARIFSTSIVPRVDSIRTRYLEKAACEWVLVLDSDEYLAADAAISVRRLLDDHQGLFDGFEIPRYNKIAGQIMRGNSWYPDHQLRLFRKGTVSWDDATHRHPKSLTGSHRIKRLSPLPCLHIHHDNYRDVRHFIRKQLQYALDDNYDDDPGGFDFSDYMAEAYKRLAIHGDVRTDGDLAHALSLVMAWDQIVRGLVHWDSLNPRPPLAHLRVLPIRQSRSATVQTMCRKALGRLFPRIGHLKNELFRVKEAIQRKLNP